MLQKISAEIYNLQQISPSIWIVFYLFVFSLQEDHAVMSFTINSTGQLALLNVATQVCRNRYQISMRPKYGTRCT